MASFVFCHFVNGIVNGVEVELLSPLGDCKLAFACACFGSLAQFEVLLGGRRNYLAEKFCKLCCMFCFFICITLESFGYFGITFALCNPGHCKIHAYFGAFAGEVSVKSVHNLLVVANAVADNVLASKLGFIGFLYGNKSFSFANGANFYVICHDFAAYCTSFHV